MIYVASPYTTNNRRILEWRKRAVCKYVERLLKYGIAAYSPIVHTIGLSRYSKRLPMKFRYYAKVDRDMLSVAKELHVLMLPGWRESVGVIQEIIWALERKIPIKLIPYES